MQKVLLGKMVRGVEEQIHLKFIQKMVNLQELQQDKLSNVLKESIGETKDFRHVLTLTV